MKRASIHIVLIDDHEMVRRGLRAFFEGAPDFYIVGEAATAAQAIMLVERLQPQLVLLDLQLPDASGVETLRKLQTVAPKTRILVVTGHSDEATVLAALRNGAHGYVLKDVRTDDLLSAARAVAQGRSYLDPNITQQALTWIRSSSLADSPSQGLAKLSRQERLIMPLLAEGKTNKEIAAQLHLSDKTVKNYLANIFFKIQVKRRSEAVAWFVRESRSSYTTTTPTAQKDS